MTSADAQTGLSLSLAGPALLRAVVDGRDGGGIARAVMIHRSATTGATTDARDQSCVLAALCATQWHRIRGGNDGKRAVRQRAGIDGCVLAGRKLPVGRPDLSLR